MRQCCQSVLAGGDSVSDHKIAGGNMGDKIMAIDTIRDWNYGSRDYSVYGDNYYFGQGQGCGTLWFPDYQTMKRFLLVFGEMSGKDWGMCDCCGCSSAGRDKFDEFACSKWKKNIIHFAKLGTLLKHKGSNDILILKALGRKQARLYNSTSKYSITLSADHYKDDCLDGSIFIAEED